MPAQVDRVVIDSEEFARKRATLSGSLPVSALTRVKAGLSDDSGSVEYRLQGGCDTRGRPTLAVEVSGVLRLTCQRCLGVIEFPLRIASTLVVADAGRIAAAGEGDNEVEWLESSPELDVTSLVEDEIILEMPYSARHADGDCSAAAAASERAAS